MKKNNDFYLSQEIIDLGKKITELSNNEFEYGIGIDEKGNILEAITSKERKVIYIPIEYVKKINNGSFIHNHPESFSFSLPDFILAHKSKCKIYAKVLNSSQKQKEGFYIFIDAHKQNRQKISILFEKFFKLEQSKLYRRAKKGDKIDYDKENKNLEHKVWKKIKKRTNIIYLWIGIDNENRNS